MHPIVLIVHSWLRWAVVLAGLWTVAEALRGARPGASRAPLVFTIVLDVQLLVGVLLYVAFSSITRAAMENMGLAMREPSLRFWAVEHPALMVLAVVFAHVGRMVGRRGVQLGERPRSGVVWYLLALAAILIAIPWPFLGHPRPWLRW